MIGALTYQPLQGNPLPCGNPTGGWVKELWVIRAHEVLSLPGCCNETHTLTGQIEIAGNTAFKKYEFNPGEMYFEELGEDTPSGPLFNQEVFGIANGISQEVVAEIGRMTGGEYILWIALHSGKVRIMGAPDNPAQLLNNIRHGRGLRETPKTDWRFYRKASKPACYVVDEDGNTPTVPNTLPVPTATVQVGVEANSCMPVVVAGGAVLTDGSLMTTATLPAVAYLIYSFGPAGAPWYTASIPAGSAPGSRASWTYISGTRNLSSFHEEVCDQISAGTALNFTLNPLVMAVRTGSLPLTLTVSLVVDERGQRSLPARSIGQVEIRHLCTITHNNPTTFAIILVGHDPCQMFGADFDNGDGIQSFPLSGAFDIVTDTYPGAGPHDIKLYGPPASLVSLNIPAQNVSKFDVVTPLTALSTLAINNNPIPGVVTVYNMPVLNHLIANILASATDFQATGAPQLIQFDMSNSASLVGPIDLGSQLPRGIKTIWLDNCNITALKVGNKPNLERLELDNNDLSASALDSIIAELWAQRKQTRATVDLRTNPGSGAVSARSLQMINGTGAFTGNGLVQAGWTIFL